MPRRGEHDRRLAAGREVPKLARHGQRIEEQQPLPVVDRVGRHVLAPRLGRPPLRVRCLPVPQARTQLAHGTMLLKRCALPMHATVDARVAGRLCTREYPPDTFTLLRQEDAPATRRATGLSAGPASAGMSLMDIRERSAWTRGLAATVHLK